MHDIKESDWRILRDLKVVALDRLCMRILAEIQQIAADESRTNHERYLAIFKELRRRDDDIADAFNDMSRSRALIKLLQMRRLDLISDEELSRFSAVTQDFINAITEDR